MNAYDKRDMGVVRVTVSGGSILWVVRVVCML